MFDTQSGFDMPRNFVENAMTEQTKSVEERIFTERELRQYDGSQGRPVYIAYDGIVYDVTESLLWRTGMHQDLHYAGIDLMRSLPKAPHGVEVFAHTGVKRIGRLIV